MRGSSHTSVVSHVFDAESRYSPRLVSDMAEQCRLRRESNESRPPRLALVMDKILGIPWHVVANAWQQKRTVEIPIDEHPFTYQLGVQQ